QMSYSLPVWLPWVEIAFAAPACVICVFLFIILIIIPLSNGCKVFLYINTVALFSLAVCQGLIAEWTARNKRGIGPEELYFFPLIVTHQGLYLVSTASLFYLNCERLLLCFHPTFYESHRWKLIPSLIVALALEALIVIPLTLMLQYGELDKYLFQNAVICISIVLQLLLICYRQSSHYYSTLFANVRLNIRYQVKEVIELTRVLIPVGIISMILKLSIEVLATFVFTDASYVSTSVLVLRFVATTMAYVEPILLMLRHRSMSRKVIMLIYPGRIELERSVELSTEQMTRSYFDALQRE
ncbi:hypothetical protein PENTCL1PPCAC_13800, partial [Pristionchus entomophagus]